MTAKKKPSELKKSQKPKTETKTADNKPEKKSNVVERPTVCR